MKLNVLLDNNTIIDRYLIGEPGVSYFIRDEEISIIFDTGYSDAFVRNAQRLGLDILNADFVVISHGHMDHTWGLDPLIRLHEEAKMEGLKRKIPRLVAHEEAFEYKEIDGQNIGSLLTTERLKRHFEMSLVKEPVWITKRMVFLGEIERTNSFENKTPVGKVEKNGVMVDDYLIDDSAIAYKSTDGLVIITGCSHPGICNIIEYAKKVCGDDRIADVIGGLHLLKPDRTQLLGTVEYIRDCGVKKLHACHCTDLESKIELSKGTVLEDVGVGLEIEYE